MNEEWFGVCAKGKPDERGLYELFPRMAFEALGDIHHIDVYSTTPNDIMQHFDAVRKQLENK